MDESRARHVLRSEAAMTSPAGHKLKVGDRVAREAPLPRRGTVRAIFDDDPDVVEVRWDSEGLPLAITRESAAALIVLPS